MTIANRGTVGIADDRAWVEFERTLEATIDRVWAMISTAEGLASWLAPSTVDLRLGGQIDIDFGEDGLAGGTIVDLEPGTALEYHWQFPGEPDSVIRFELTSLNNGHTRIRIHHRLLPIEQAVGYGAGWHAHLDQMETVLANVVGFDWDARFGELLPDYQASMTV